MKYYFNLLLTLFVFNAQFGYSQEINVASLDKNIKLQAVAIGFYNLENLFDTIVDPDTNKILQEDFTPHGQKHFDSKKYAIKLKNMSEAISKIATDQTPDGVAVLGVAEIENKAVLEDLVAQDAIKDRGYQIVHYDSPDHRGIDVGFLYQPKYFKVLSSKTYSVKNPESEHWSTRDQLLVTGELLGEKMHFIVAHWPSRRGGEKKSAPKRMLAAKVSKHIIDSLLADDPNAKVIFMGDLNDDPNSASLVDGLESVGKAKKLEDGKLFNPMDKLNRQGIGTIGWRGSWNLFDQMVIAQPLISKGNDLDSFKYMRTYVFNKAFLTNKTGQYQGGPWRTYAGPNFIGGYSDHFPVYMFLIREQK